MSKAAVSIEGFIANELSIREASGHRIVEVSVPHTPQKQVDGQWVDAGDTVWYKASFWNDHADKVLMTVGKGELVTITGTPKLDLYVKDGNARGSIVIEFPTIAVVVRKPKRGESVQQTPPAADDTWSQSGSTGYNDETPF